MITRNPAARLDWLYTLDSAALRCWCPGCDRQNWEIHHIVGGGAGRSDEPCNFAILCRLNHQAFHASGRVIWFGEVIRKLTLAELLWLKREYDPQHYDAARLEELRGQALPELRAA